MREVYWVRRVLALLFIIVAWSFSYWVMARELGEPQSVWLWCTMLRLC